MSEPTRMTAESGGSKDLKIERYDQIPTGPLAELAARFGIGALKYEQKEGLDNWRHGYPWSWSYRALIGHANDFWGGEDVDPGTYVGTDNDSPFDKNGDRRPGVLHLAAVAWHALVMIDWLETHPEYDDRPSTVIERNKLARQTADAIWPAADKPYQGEPPALQIFDKVTWIDAPGDICTVIGVTWTPSDLDGHPFRYAITNNRTGRVHEGIRIRDLVKE